MSEAAGMQILDTPLSGCKLIRPVRLRDERGHFARLLDVEALAAAGLDPTLAQASLSYNIAAGTLRGLHYQAHPRMEAKIVRCTRGAVFDVAVDLRKGSPTFGRWHAAELSQDNDDQLFIPAGFAHGFQTLTPDATLAYHIGVPYEASLAAGLRFDDPDVAIAWPLPPAHLSARDLALPFLSQLDRAGLIDDPAAPA